MFKRVYILKVRDDYELKEVLGVFTSLYKAKKKLLELEKNNNKDNEYYYYIDSYKIDELSKKIKYYK